MIVNWAMPSVFGLVWFGVWSGTALDWQISGSADIVAAIKNGSAVSGLWEFLGKMPLSFIIIPVVIITLIAVVMVTFGGGASGVDGVKYLSGVGGFCVLPIFILQIAATIKVFFMDKIEEDVEINESYQGEAES